MSRHILKNYLPLLKLLTEHRLPKKCFVPLVECFDDNTIKFLCECIRNAISLNHVSKLTKGHKKRLMRRIVPYKCVIKHLCKKTEKTSAKRKIIMQKGYGFLFPLLSTIIPLVSSLLSRR